MLRLILLSITIIFFFNKNIIAKEDHKNAVTLYYGVGTNAHIEEIPTFSFEKRSAYFGGLAYNRNFYDTDKLFGLSLEYELGDCRKSNLNISLIS